jgi:hypothetical protein
MAVFPIKGTFGIIAFKSGIGEISISRAHCRFVPRGEEDSHNFVRRLRERERERRPVRIRRNRYMKERETASLYPWDARLRGRCMKTHNAKVQVPRHHPGFCP